MSEYGRSEFEKHRYSTYKDLEELSIALDNSSTDRLNIATQLSSTKAGLNDILTRALFEKTERGADVPRCFESRVELMKEIISALADALGTTDRMVRRAVLMMAYLSSHVARLTLDAHDERFDRTARKIEEGLAYLELNWVPLSVEVPEAAEALGIIGEKWASLDVAVGSCDCIQCERRRQSS